MRPTLRPSVPEIHITDPQDVEWAAYRALAGQAVLGLMFGLLAPLAIVDPILWAIPATGALLSGWGLRRIHKNPTTMAGRKMALAGLTLSLLFLVAAPAHWTIYRWIVRNEARQVAALWFQYLAHDEPHKAYQLQCAPQVRQPLDDRLWDFFRDNAKPRELLKEYVRQPLVRTLLALGPRAKVRYYETTGQDCTTNVDEVFQLYAVTYDESGERKSFFVGLRLSRMTLPNGDAGWRVTETNGGTRPAEWQAPEKDG